MGKTVFAITMTTMVKDKKDNPFFNINLYKS
jgi:hypothetical protein